MCQHTQLIVREYRPEDLPALVRIWNEVVEDGVAFPQEELLTAETGAAFFAAQTYTAAAVDADTGTVYGLYILHPNNVGRCGHICNASYAVERAGRAASECCSSTPSSRPTRTRGTCMSASGLPSSASSPAASA